MKKILYSSLLLAGLVASYEMNATGKNGAGYTPVASKDNFLGRNGHGYAPKHTDLGYDQDSRPPVRKAPKSGEIALNNADTETLIGRIESVQEKIKNNNYSSDRAYQLRDFANDTESAVYPETAKQEALISLGKTKKALRDNEFHKNKRKVVSSKLAKLEALA